MIARIVKIQIHNCFQCPHKDSEVIWCDLVDRAITHTGIIPDWCPLPGINQSKEKTEPIPWGTRDPTLREPVERWPLGQRNP